MDASVVALLCRTSDRTPGGARGARALAELLAERAGGEARIVGSPGQPESRQWDEDLRDAHGCLLEAGGQLEDLLGAGKFPILTASDCSISMTTLPTVTRLVPDVRVLWLDAHGDFNTPASTESGFLGGMCLAGACGEWPTGFDGALDPANLTMVGVRDLEASELVALDLAGVARVERFADVADAVDSAEVYVHLDLDVLDPDVFPAQFPAAGGLSEVGLQHLLDEVSQAAQRIVGLEITSCEVPEDDAECARLTELVADVVAPLLPL